MAKVDVEVAIVGAGAAGLSAAALLREHGVACLLLEARDRIGGRAFTASEALGTPFDLGASYLHAVDQGNPWMGIARAQGEPTVADPRRRLLFDAGAAVDADREAGFGAAAGRAWQAIAAAAHDHRPHALADLLPRATMADHYVAALMGPWLCGEDTDRLDAQDFIAARHGEDRLVPGGYGRLVARFGAGLPVRLDCPVRELRTRRDHVDLVTGQGTLRASRVILTVPLGVLAAERIRFDPPLPAAVLAALDGLPMGQLMKVGIAFDRDPFGHGDTFYATAPPRGERSILYLARPFGHDHAMAFVGGSLAREIGAMPPADARNAVTAPLVEMLGTGVRAQIGNCLVSDWHRDRWAQGSYAVARPGMAGTRAALRVPWSERLRYAGEAAAGDGWHATVAGAYLSGRDAARAVVDDLGDCRPNVTIG